MLENTFVPASALIIILAKKLFIVALIFFLLASSSLVVYNFVLPGFNKNDRDNGDEKKPLNLEIKQVSDKKAFSLTIDESGQSIKYYLKNDGRVAKSNFDGSSSAVAQNTALPDLYWAVWSPDKKKVLSFFKTPSAVKRYSFDYNSRQGVVLSENIKSAAFSPSGEKIVYQYVKEQNQQNDIAVANADTSNWKIIFQTRLENLVVLWPRPDKIYLLDMPSGAKKGSLFSLSYPAGDFKKIVSDKFGFSAKISPDGQKILYQTTDERGKNLKLFVSDSGGDNESPLPVATLAEKCVWSQDSQNIFCAVPQKLSEFAIWPDDYSGGRITVKDDFYIIDTATNKKTKIAGSSDQQTFDATELTLSPQEDYLFFIDRLAGFVYGIKLRI